jgi:hypothetical protein
VCVCVCVRASASFVTFLAHLLLLELEADLRVAHEVVVIQDLVCECE